MKEIDYLKKLYKQNVKNNSFIIEIFLDKYTDVFNKWDSAYFLRRDLDPDLISFLDRCSEDIPIKYNLELLFKITEPKNNKMEELVIGAIKSYYKYSIMAEEKKIKKLFVKMLKYVSISITFLILAFYSEPHLPNNLISKTLREGLNIGGWVFLWEAISLFSFNMSDTRNKIKEYKRFLISHIIFEYNNII